jgi:hypothetical protein
VFVSCGWGFAKGSVEKVKGLNRRSLGLLTQRTFAKYLHTFSAALVRSWLKGHALPAWQAPCLKNLHGTCEVSVGKKSASVTWSRKTQVAQLNRNERACVRLSARGSALASSSQPHASHPRGIRARAVPCLRLLFPALANLLVPSDRGGKGDGERERELTRRASWPVKSAATAGCHERTGIAAAGGGGRRDGEAAGPHVAILGRIGRRHLLAVSKGEQQRR